jgi:hypothetical protein
VAKAKAEGVWAGKLGFFFLFFLPIYLPALAELLSVPKAPSAQVWFDAVIPLITEAYPDEANLPDKA